MRPLSLLFLVACGSSAKESPPIQGGETCTALVSGAWTFTGAAWGMADNPMDGDVTMDSTACTFTLDNWDMRMDDLPTGGALDGDQVQFDGLNSYWRSCTGTATDEQNAAGVCADDGAEWVITARG